MPENVDHLFVGPQQPMTEVLAVLNHTGGIGIALVVNEKSELLGTVTDGDVRRALLDGKSMDEPAQAIMNAQPITAAIGASQEELLALLRTHRKRQIPLIANGQVVDIMWTEQLLEAEQPVCLSTPTVIMCGGTGTRLRPLTDDTPKPLLPVGGKPILERLIEGLSRQGITEIYLAVNYQAAKIEEHCGDGQKWGVHIQYTRESQSLGTVGALGLLAGQLTEPALVLNGDLLTEVRYTRLLEFHVERGFDLSLGMTPYQIQVPYGVVTVQGEQVSQLEEKPTYSFFTNAGIYVLNPDVISLIPHNQYYDMTQLINQLLGQKGRVGAFPIHEYWLDIGNPSDYAIGDRDLWPRSQHSQEDSRP